MSKILIIFSTTDGHTRKICQRLQQNIEKNGDQVELISIEEISPVELEAFDKIVIGASIRYGKHSPAVYAFISDNIQILENKRNAFFTVNVVARKPEKNQPDTNPYLKKFLTQIVWKPQNLAVFAGKINYQMYQFRDRFMIRFIMWITKGPTALDTNVEFTDWDRVDEFARTISEM
jgi:menaquinone-dependent protoporphyrinogen oxidase